MSGQETIKLDEANCFCTVVRVADPVTGKTFSLDCDIDTGNPDALALPTDYKSYLTKHLGTKSRGGAGIGQSDIYAAEIQGIGDLDISHVTSVYFSLPSSMPRGLIGMDLLKFMVSEIYGGPDGTMIDVDPVYL